MNSVEKIIYIPAGILLLLVFPVISLLWTKNVETERQIQRTCRELIDSAYEEGMITREDYIYTYEKCLLLDEKRDIRLRVIHLEGKREAELSDYFYTCEDAEIREILENGPLYLEKGSLLEIYE